MSPEYYYSDRARQRLRKRFPKLREYNSLHFILSHNSSTILGVLFFFRNGDSDNSWELVFLEVASQERSQNQCPGHEQRDSLSGSDPVARKCKVGETGRGPGDYA